MEKDEYYELAVRLWAVHPRQLDAAGYVHKNHGGKYDNPRAAWYADQIRDFVASIATTPAPAH